MDLNNAIPCRNRVGKESCDDPCVSSFDNVTQC